MISRTYLVCITLVAVACIVVAAATVPDDDFLLIIYDLSVGFVLSAVFYVIVVHLPERNRRRIVHAGLKEQYDQFRRSCIHIFLILSKSQSYPNRDALLDKEEFKRYFKNNNDEGENRWDAVANGLQRSEFYLREVIYELRMLSDEIRFVRSTLHVNDVEAYEFLGRLSRAIIRMEATSPDYDEIKSFCGFLWQIFAGWSWVHGYSKSNVIEEMVERAQ